MGWESPGAGQGRNRPLPTPLPSCLLSGREPGCQQGWAPAPAPQQHLPRPAPTPTAWDGRAPGHEQGLQRGTGQGRAGGAPSTLPGAREEPARGGAGRNVCNDRGFETTAIFHPPRPRTSGAPAAAAGPGGRIAERSLTSSLSHRQQGVLRAGAGARGRGQGRGLPGHEGLLCPGPGVTVPGRGLAQRLRAWLQPQSTIPVAPSPQPNPPRAPVPRFL